MFILCILHDVVFSEYSTYFSDFYIFHTQDEEGYEDATGKDVVQGLTLEMELEAPRRG